MDNLVAFVVGFVCLVSGYLFGIIDGKSTERQKWCEHLHEKHSDVEACLEKGVDGERDAVE